MAGLYGARHFAGRAVGSRGLEFRSRHPRRHARTPIEAKGPINFPSFEPSPAVQPLLRVLLEHVFEVSLQVELGVVEIDVYCGRGIQC